MRGKVECNCLLVSHTLESIMELNIKCTISLHVLYDSSSISGGDLMQYSHILTSTCGGNLIRNEYVGRNCPMKLNVRDDLYFKFEE